MDKSSVPPIDMQAVFAKIDKEMFSDIYKILYFVDASSIC